MKHNVTNYKGTENGLRYIELDGHVITVTVKNSMFTIKICNPTKHELCTFTKIDITSGILWNPEYKQQKYMITPGIYNDML